MTILIEFSSLYALESSRQLALGLVLAWEVSVCLFYTVVRFAPASWFFRRPALYAYAAFWCVGGAAEQSRANESGAAACKLLDGAAYVCACV